MADTKLIKKHDIPDSGLGSSPGTTLYDLTEACFALFGSIVSTADSDKPEDSRHPDSSVVSRCILDIQGLQKSFAQWVDYTGARAPIHVSLDNKLRDHGDIREMIEMLLKMMERNLRRLGRKDKTEAASSAIEAALERLHLLARAIRKASVRKQDQSISKFSDDGDNDIRKLAAAFVGWKFPNALPALCEHVGYTIEARRRVLKLNIRRADRRAQKRPETSHRTAASSDAPYEIPKPPPALQGARRLLVQSVANTQPTQQSGLDANIFRAFAGSKRLDLATPSIPSTPGEGSGAMTAGYPDPPEIKPGDVSVPCPYCKESLSAAQIRREKGKKSSFWRRHVEDHLQPYGCLFRQCANVWFAREADWTEHMSTVHAANWPRIVHTITWYCDLDHDTADDTPKTFSTETVWREHMLNVNLHPKHSDQPTLSQLETLSIQKQKLAPREKGSCPFCTDIPEEMSKSSAPIALDNDPRLMRHISKHIHYLSFFAFRFLENASVPEDEQISVGSKVSTIQVMLKPGELAIPPEGGDDLAHVLLNFRDIDDEIVWSYAKNHLYREERSYIDEDFESDEQDPLTTLRQDVPDDEQKNASWNFLPRREIPIRAADEAFKTWLPSLLTPIASTEYLDGRTHLYLWTSQFESVALSNFSNERDLPVTSQEYFDSEYSSGQLLWPLIPDDESGSWDFLPQAYLPLTSTDDDLKNWNRRRRFGPDEVPEARDGFRIALICALPMVYDAVSLLLDRSYEAEGLDYSRAPGDNNHYTTGCISGRHVVLLFGGSQPEMTVGSVSRASMIHGLKSSFQNLELVLIVGFCGGVPVIPNADPENRDLFLGDVVISTQVLRLDFGKHVADGFHIKTDDPRKARSHAVQELLQQELKSEKFGASFMNNTMKYLKELRQKVVEEGYKIDYERPDPSSDILFVPEASHSHYNDCDVCAASPGIACGAARTSSCEDLGCGKTENTASKDSDIARSRQNTPMEQDLRVFHGPIGTTDQVIKSGLARDRIAAQCELVAFLPEEFTFYLEELPHVVVSGVCDYSDSHKPPKKWQSFAAATAAAVVKALLQTCKFDVVGMTTKGVCDYADSFKSKTWQSYASETAASYAKELLHRAGADDAVADSAQVSRAVSESEIPPEKESVVHKKGEDI